MDDQSERSAFEFTGNWREFAPIAFTNLLLCIVTLGIYTFWARTRERQYLWSHTRMIDDQLEWTGTGVELLIGAILAAVMLGGPVLFLQFGLQAMVLRGYGGLAGLIALMSYFAVLYLVGFAIFRALRYRLSRTYWHGIRGGSDDQGFNFGLSYVWRTLAGSLAAGLLVPWSMVSLWNARWNKMSFGSQRFESDASYSPIMGRYLLFYLVPVLLVVGGVVAAAVFAPTIGQVPSAGTTASLFLVLFVVYILFFVVLGAVALAYYAAYFREVVGHLSLGELTFSFDARTADWLKLAIGNLALVVFTLGIGQIFLGYRNWSFFARHLNVYGHVYLEALGQSTTREPGQGEGLLDAFDVGAF